MDLWIRSQNREDLSKVEHLGVYDKKIYINGYEEHGYCIGDYATKERALEVLDEIQKKINLVCLGHDFGSPMIDLKNPTYIYEMPKE